MKKTIPSIIILILLAGFFQGLIAQPNLTPDEQLGKAIFFDKISSPDNMACAECHGPSVGFTGPNPAINKKGGVYKGAVPHRYGNRKPPSAAYATFSPVFHYDDDEGLFIGGNFWDGRATGEVLGNPAADQALGPFLNPVEQNNPNKESVLMQIAEADYAYLWETVWGEPISYSTAEKTAENYDRVGLSIAAYEASAEVNSFSSKYDYFLAGMTDLTEEESNGLVLFEGKAMCSACHPSEPGPVGEPPLFTDFSFDNLGTPKNPDNPFYKMDKVYLPDGTPINPLGKDWIDKGLGGYLMTRPDYADKAADNMGKHKVPTLRNVGKKPGNGYPKAYLHNGFFKTLKEVVQFYNTRDVEDWPDPEVAANINTSELGDLELTDDEVNAVVSFMETLSDGYKLPKSSAAMEGFKQSITISPNPATINTRIAYTLTHANTVNICLYTLNGEKIDTIREGWQSIGRHELSFNTTHLTNGVYIIGAKIGHQLHSLKLAVTN